MPITACFACGEVEQPDDRHSIGNDQIGVAQNVPQFRVRQRVDEKVRIGRSHLMKAPLRDELLQPQGWAREEVRIPTLTERLLKVFYCYHPTLGYKRSPSIAPFLA